MRKSDYEAPIESLYFGMVLPRGNGMDAAENAGGGDRTHTILRSLDFESSASASSATPAKGIKLQKRSRSSSIRRRVRTQRASLPLARASLLAGEYVFSVG
jgi:hypothetical protein